MLHLHDASNKKKEEKFLTIFPFSLTLQNSIQRVKWSIFLLKSKYALIFLGLNNIELEFKVKGWSFSDGFLKK